MTDTIIPLTPGEIEMEGTEDNPVREFARHWPERKRQPGWLEGWLGKQYVGELNAVASMEALLTAFRRNPGSHKAALLVERVVADERKHVALIGQLLVSRGIAPAAPTEPTPLAGMEEWGSGCAIASRAEAVRAGEIRIVVQDPDVADDVKQAFRTILTEEAFHERAFRQLAGEQNMADNVVFSDWCPRPGCSA